MSVNRARAAALDAAAKRLAILLRKIDGRGMKELPTNDYRSLFGSTQSSALLPTLAKQSVCRDAKKITNDWRNPEAPATRKHPLELAYRHMLGFTGERCKGRRQWRGDCISARAQGAPSDRHTSRRPPDAAAAPVRGCPLSCETRAGSGRAPTTSRMGLFKGKQREKTEAEQVAEDYNIIGKDKRIHPEEEEEEDEEESVQEPEPEPEPELSDLDVSVAENEMCF